MAYKNGWVAAASFRNARAAYTVDIPLEKLSRLRTYILTVSPQRQQPGPD